MASAGKNNGSNKKAPASGSASRAKSTKEIQSKQQVNTFEKIDRWLEQRSGVIFVLSVFFTVFFSAFLFEAKISTGGDDSHYIEMANDFVKGRAFPTWHGPLYPIFLSLPMLILGVKVVALKLFSFAFIIGHLFLFYYTFRKHVSPLILSLVLLIISVNSSILYFGSQTYSEAMFMFLQALVIFLFVRTYEMYKPLGKFNFKEQGLSWFILGFFVFLMSITRDIGIMVLAAIVIVLLTEKKWKESLTVFASYLVFLIPFKLYKSLVWSAHGQRPFREILLKNFYNPSEGYENFSGMVTRILENAKQYFSKHLMIALGLHDPFSVDKSWFVTWLVIGLMVVALVYSFRRSKIMLFIALYLGAAIAATFFALQQAWDQMRMVVIYIPMMLILMAWGVQQLSTRKGLNFLAIVLPILLVLIFFRVMGQTTDKMKANRKVLSKNLSGNQYYGFTPDWQNFLLMSKWVGEHIPDTAVVASRKPSMSFIYSNGRDFYGMYRFPSEEPSKLVTELKTRVGDMTVIPNADFEKNLPPAVQLSLKKAAVAYVAEGNTIYGLYDTRGPMESILKQAGTDYKVPTFTTDSLLYRVKISQQSCFAVSPDTLVNALKKSRVSYIIVASLRANPNMNTGNIINNIQRYLYFVVQKYPNILTLVHQVGADAEEPAWLYQVNYNSYHL
jgi:hypothetical protein